MGIIGRFIFNLFNRKPPVPPPDDPNDPISFVSELLNLHNNVRNYPLTLNNKLNAAAQKHAKWMAMNNEMSHDGVNRSDPSDRIESEGYNFRICGENIAAGQNSSQSVFNDWMDSKGHRTNILNKSYKEVGFGLAKSNNGTDYWCAVFASQN